MKELGFRIGRHIKLHILVKRVRPKQRRNCANIRDNSRSVNQLAKNESTSQHDMSASHLTCRSLIEYKWKGRAEDEDEFASNNFLGVGKQKASSRHT